MAEAASVKASAPDAKATIGVRAPVRSPQPVPVSDGPVGTVCRLQQAAGNRATRELLHSSTRDAREREADVIAGQVMMTGVTTTGAMRAGVMTAGAERLPLTPLTGITPAALALHAGHLHTASHGRRLPDRTRESMEARLGTDLGDVRIHDDQPARTMTDAIDAQAFTAGHHIFFAETAREGSSEPQLLLAHELVHVMQQRTGGGLAIQRKPKSEQMVKATAADKRDYIQQAISYLKDMADFYRSKAASARVSKKKPAPFNTAKILEPWKKAIAGQLTLIETELGGDKKLIADLRRSYSAAVWETIAAAAAAEDLTVHEAFEKYRGEIHDAGWPEGSVDPGSNRLSEAIPANERAKIQVISTTLVPVANLNIQGEFEARANTSVEPAFSGTVPDALKAGLTNIAVRLMTGLRPAVLKLNSTISLALDLGKVGGDYALYRFTFWEHAERRGTSKRLIIERLGALGMDDMNPARVTAARKKFTSLQFTFKGTWRNAEKEAVLGAVDLLTDAQLSLVSGLNFARGRAHPTDPEAGGNYDVNTHTITIFDRAFNESSVRFGAGPRTASPSTFIVVHEIGHAIDRRKMRSAMVAEETAVATRKKNFASFETRPGQFELKNVPLAVLNEFTRQTQAITTANAAVGASTTESGVGFRGGVEAVDVRASTPFKTAGSGTRLSPYSMSAWEEYFAESYALFALEPDTLLRLRPRLHAYFVQLFTPPAAQTPGRGAGRGGRRP